MGDNFFKTNSNKSLRQNFLFTKFPPEKNHHFLEFFGQKSFILEKCITSGKRLYFGLKIKKCLKSFYMFAYVEYLEIVTYATHKASLLC